ncbi:MAG: prenyltransferase [Thermoplasmata archaeon]
MAEAQARVRRLADIASRGGKVPPLYVYVVFLLPGFTFSVLVSHMVNYVPFVVSAIAIVPLMAATNLYDDFFDFSYGYDKPDSPNTLYRRHPIFSYGVKPNYLLKWAVLFSIIYFLLVSVDALLFSRLIFVIGSAGFILGYGYTGPPLRYKYFGFGEAGVFLSFLLANLLVSVSCLGRVDLLSAIYSLPFSLLIVLIFLAGNTRDIEADRASGFITVPVLLGRKGAVMLLIFLVAMFYISIPVLILLKLYSPFTMFVLAGIPVAYYSLSNVLKNKGTAEWLLGPYVFLSLILLALLSLV